MLLIAGTAGLAGARGAPTPDPPTGTPAAVARAYGRLPVRFEANEGQTDPQVRFLARSEHTSVFLTPAETVLRVGGRANGVQSVVRMRAVAANPDPAVEGLELLSTRSNYVIGNDPARWRTGVANYGRVAYRDLYPGIDAVYHGEDGALEYDFVVAPGADPAAIALAFDGLERLILEGGDLVASTPAGEVRQRRPVLYQDVEGGRRNIAGGYRLQEPTGQVRFWVGTYDRSRPLVIDPVVVYSTTLGGSESDQGNAIAVDANGSVYITGTTMSSDFPTANPAQVGAGNVACQRVDADRAETAGLCSDVFVAKLDPTGTSLVYSTYLGGSLGDRGRAIAVDSGGNAYVTGDTESEDFPVTSGAYQVTRANDQTCPPVPIVGPFIPYDVMEVYAVAQGACSGAVARAPEPGCPQAATTPYHLVCSDVLVSKLNPTGGLAYSTFIGGQGDDLGFGIAVDAGGGVHVVGSTFDNDSTQFPAATTIGSLQNSSGTAYADAFYVRFTPSETSLRYSARFGGTFPDEAHAIALDAAGHAYVAGTTSSSVDSFPIRNPVQGVKNGSSDAFLSVFDPSRPGLQSLLTSTYLGGEYAEEGYGVAVDGAGAVYLTGVTASWEFPTFNPLQGNAGADLDKDAFVTKFAPGAQALAYSTYLGGVSTDIGRGISVDSRGAAYVTGETFSADFPTVHGFQGRGGSQDAFVAKIQPGGGSWDYVSYLGSNGGEAGLGVAANQTGVYVTGVAAGNFPVTGPVQGTPAVISNPAAFVIKIAREGPVGRAVADFDGNATTDLSVFRPSSGIWYVEGQSATAWGASGDLAVPGDYDGNGTADIAVFRPSNGVWYVQGGAATAFGAPGDVPVASDYDGNGKADIAVFRPSNGVWYVQGGAATPFGSTGDIPVPGDYDGDGKTDIAVFRPSNGVWYVQGAAATPFGATGDIPVPGDYDGDGRTDIAVFRPANGVWYVRGGAATAFGASGDVPVPGDYDGDGRTDIAVFRPANGVWYVGGGAATAFGTNGDRPLSLAAAITQAFFG